jgi:hypothetical protein
MKLKQESSIQQGNPRNAKTASDLEPLVMFKEMGGELSRYYTSSYPI